MQVNLFYWGKRNLEKLSVLVPLPIFYRNILDQDQVVIWKIAIKSFLIDIFTC